MALAAALTVGGCGPPSGRTADGKLTVAVSILPQAWLVRQIGGDDVEVVTVVKPGASHETYQPSDADMSRVMAAAVFFRLGVPFERSAWFEAIQESQRLKIVDTQVGIELREMEVHVHQTDDGHGDHGAADADHSGHAHDDAHGHAHDECHPGGKDPHIWLTPQLLEQQATIMAATLAEIDPSHADVYMKNLAALKQQLQEVDARIRARLRPYSGRMFFVFHPAWGYFADEYGLRQVPIEMEGKSPSDSELTQLQELARQAKTRVVFVQPQIFGRAAEAVAKAVGGRVELLDPLREDVPEGLEAAAAAIAASFE